jgi:HPt (histidine-containing phosphotransfer) domain-containing protein
VSAPAANKPTVTATPAAPAASSVPTIPGINSAPALRRMMGNSTLYLATLRKFCDLQECMTNTMCMALDKDDWQTAQRHAHSLKGVAASVGADDLSQSAAALEEKLANRAPRDEVDAGIGALEVQLAELTAAVRRSLPAVAPPDRPVTNMPAALAAVAELDHLLAESNPEAMAWLEHNSHTLSGLLSPATLSRLEAAVRSCDLDDALNLLREALKNEAPV